MYLEKSIDKRIKLKKVINYRELIEKFEKYEIDFAYIDAFAYINLKDRYDYAKPLVIFKNKKGKISSSCSLVTSLVVGDKNSIALSDPMSTCTAVILKDIVKEDIKKYRYEYLIEYDKIARKVLQGSFSMGTLNSSDVKMYYHLGLEEIDKTNSYPSKTLIVNTKTVSKKDIDIILHSLVNSTKKERRMWSKIFKYGANKVDDSYFNSLREIMKSQKGSN